MACVSAKEASLKDAIGEEAYSMLCEAIKDNIGGYIDDRWYYSTDDLVHKTAKAVYEVLKPVIEGS